MRGGHASTRVAGVAVRDELEKVGDRLRGDIVVWLTTVRPDGQPQTTPVWFLWEGETLLVYSRPGKPKLRNIAANTAVVLALRMDETGDDVVVIEGRAERREDVPAAHENADYVGKYAGPISALGYDPEGFAGDYSEPIRITATRVRSW